MLSLILIFLFWQHTIDHLVKTIDIIEIIFRETLTSITEMAFPIKIEYLIWHNVFAGFIKYV